MNFKKVIRLIIHPKFILLKLDQRNFIHLSDELFIKIAYEYDCGKKLNLDNPKTFNEKMQWLKLNDRKKIYTTMVDKYEVKKFITKLIGEQYIIPTLGVWDKFEDIDFDKLPNQFVLKCTHDSGGIVICKDKKNFNIEDARKKINKLLKRDYYKIWREWPYKDVRPRILADKYMIDESGLELKDYKLFCFNGKPKICLVCSDRFKELKETWFDENWKNLHIIEGNHKNDDTIEKPKTFEEMKKIASKISKNIPFVRVDFYEIDKKAYFGEITFYPSSGVEKFEQELWNEKFGDMIDLKEIKKENHK